MKKRIVKNMSNKCISVIVPIYNQEKYVNRCIESIVNQTYKNLQIILVNDGSTDNSGKICDDWAQKDCRIQVCHKSNRGLVNSRKRGVMLSKGDYIAHVDSDDWIEPEMYARMLTLAIKNDADIVTSGIIRDYENYSIVEYEHFETGVYKDNRLEKEYWPNVIATDKFFKTNVNIHITNKLYKRELALKHQMELSDNIRIGEDAAMVYPAIFDAKCIVVSGRNFYHYVIHLNSMMNIVEKGEISNQYIEKRFNNVVDEKKSKIPRIKAQLDRVVLYIKLFEKPQYVLKIYNKKLYPFQNLDKGNKVIIYGAGRFGTRLVKYLNETNYCSVVAWCDKITKDNVISIEDALQNNYDKIIIAVLLADIADEIEQILINKKIEKYKICRVKITET